MIFALIEIEVEIEFLYFDVLEKNKKNYRGLILAIYSVLKLPTND
jgi:hypothetical protein